MEEEIQNEVKKENAKEKIYKGFGEIKQKVGVWREQQKAKAAEEKARKEELKVLEKAKYKEARATVEKKKAEDKGTREGKEAAERYGEGFKEKAQRVGETLFTARSKLQNLDINFQDNPMPDITSSFRGQNEVIRNTTENSNYVIKDMDRGMNIMRDMDKTIGSRLGIGQGPANKKKRKEMNFADYL